jgi:hypothetical protein
MGKSSTSERLALVNFDVRTGPGTYQDIYKEFYIVAIVAVVILYQQ